MMGLPYTTLKLTNLFRQQSVEVTCLVDTGATFLCVPEAVAVQLGFDITETSQQFVTLADGSQRKVPKIAPIEIAFENRSYVTEAVVLGNEALLGVIPLEAMDLIVDPRQQKLIVNPQHPNYPVALAKMSSAFSSIKQGLEEALALSQGTAGKAIIHQFSPLDVKEVRAKTIKNEEK